MLDYCTRGSGVGLEFISALDVYRNGSTGTVLLLLRLPIAGFIGYRKSEEELPLHPAKQSSAWIASQSGQHEGGGAETGQLDTLPIHSPDCQTVWT